MYFQLRIWLVNQKTEIVKFKQQKICKAKRWICNNQKLWNIIIGMDAKITQAFRKIMKSTRNFFIDKMREALMLEVVYL